MVSKSDLKKPLKSLTILDQERVKKYKKGQEEERIEVLGQESEEKALPWVQKEVATQEKIDQDYFFMVMELLKKAQTKKVDYFKVLSQVFTHFLKEEDIPQRYFLDIEVNDIGIKVEIKDTAYYGAFKVCGLPSYDFRAAQMLAIKVGNTVAKLEGYTYKSPGGIALPDKEDLRIYGSKRAN